MKKFLSFILIILFLVPIACTFSACEFLNPPNGTPATTPSNRPTDEPEDTTPAHPLENKIFACKTLSVSWQEGTTQEQKDLELRGMKDFLGINSEEEYFEAVKSLALIQDLRIEFKEQGRIVSYADGTIQNGTFTLSNTLLTVVIDGETCKGTLTTNGFSLSQKVSDNSYLAIIMTFEQTTGSIVLPTMSGTYSLQSCDVTWIEGVSDTQKALAKSNNNCTTDTALFNKFKLSANSTIIFNTDGTVTVDLSSGSNISISTTASYIEDGNTITISFLGETLFKFTKVDDTLVSDGTCDEPFLQVISTFAKVSD